MKTQEQISYEALLDEHRALILKLREARRNWTDTLKPGDVFIVGGDPAIFSGRTGDRLETISYDGHRQPVSMREEFGTCAMVPYSPDESVVVLATRAVSAEGIHWNDGGFCGVMARMIAMDPQHAKNMIGMPSSIPSQSIHERVENLKKTQR